MASGATSFQLPVRRFARGPVAYGVAAVLAAVPAVVHAAGKKPRQTDGPYNVTVGGWYAGSWRAVVAGPVVLITLRVTDVSGAAGQLVGTDLRIAGSHVCGAGLVFGRQVTFTGRLDGYSGDRHFRGARVLCSFVEAGSGRRGRVAGGLQ